jgi:hypothetical protein
LRTSFRSLQQSNAEVFLFINGTSQGGLAGLTGLAFNGGQAGYITIWAEPGQAISNLKLANSPGDGFLLNHLAFLPVTAGSNFLITSFALATCGSTRWTARSSPTCG